MVVSAFGSKYLSTPTDNISCLTTWNAYTQIQFLSLSALEGVQWFLPTGFSTLLGNSLSRGSSVDSWSCLGVSDKCGWHFLVIWLDHTNCSLSALNLIPFSLSSSITVNFHHVPGEDPENSERGGQVPHPPHPEWKLYSSGHAVYSIVCVFVMQSKVMLKSFGR